MKYESAPEPPTSQRLPGWLAQWQLSCKTPSAPCAYKPLVTTSIHALSPYLTAHSPAAGRAELAYTGKPDVTVTVKLRNPSLNNVVIAWTPCTMLCPGRSADLATGVRIPARCMCACPCPPSNAGPCRSQAAGRYAAQ